MYSDSSKKFGLVHLRRKVVRECERKDLEVMEVRMRTHRGQVAGTTNWDNSKSIH